ncbi:MAG: serine hydrolase [Christiangramia sp.]|nr:serine hydrolase [Christiangramia sp.]
MRRIRNIFSVVILIFIQLNDSNIVAQEAIPSRVKENIRQRVDNHLNTSISVGVIDKDGKHFFNYGQSSEINGITIDENSVYEIGSITKTFTGTLLAQLVLSGELKLEDPIDMYLPDSINVPKLNGEKIRLVHLANHSSGLPRIPDNLNPENSTNPFADYTEDQLYEFLDNFKLNRAPGEKSEYSNLATGLLGHIIAKSQNTTYAELLSEMILDPLDMNDTRVFPEAGYRKRIAVGHTAAEPVDNWIFTTNTLAGAGAILSTTNDMLNYLGASSGLLDSDLKEAMRLSQKDSGSPEKRGVVGLGWSTMTIKGKDITWHNGGTGGFRSFAGFIPGSNRAVIVLSNSSESVDDIGLHLLNPEIELKNKKASIALQIRKAIDSEGVDAGEALYHQLKREAPEEYNFGADELNGLGYYYLRMNKLKKALTVFSLNVESHPNSFNVYDSLGEAYLKKGDTIKAIENYRKSVELNPDHQGGIQKLRELKKEEIE